MFLPWNSRSNRLRPPGVSRLAASSLSDSLRQLLPKQPFTYPHILIDNCFRLIFDIQ